MGLELETHEATECQWNVISRNEHPGEAVAFEELLVIIPAPLTIRHVLKPMFGAELDRFRNQSRISVLITVSDHRETHDGLGEASLDDQFIKADEFAFEVGANKLRTSEILSHLLLDIFNRFPIVPEGFSLSDFRLIKDVSHAGD